MTEPFFNVGYSNTAFQDERRDIHKKEVRKDARMKERTNRAPKKPPKPGKSKADIMKQYREGRKEEKKQKRIQRFQVCFNK